MFHLLKALSQPAGRVKTEQWALMENDRGGRKSHGEKKERDKQQRQRIRKRNKVIKEIWETGKSEKSRTCFLIFSPPGRRKQTDKEERDNKEKMDCSISQHPQASEEKREREEDVILREDEENNKFPSLIISSLCHGVKQSRKWSGNSAINFLLWKTF